MNKKILFVLIPALFFSCSKNQFVTEPQDQEPAGSREFKIQSSKPAFKVTLVGVYMGTPDYDAVWSLIEAADSRGQIDRIVQYAAPFEGGVAHCIEIANSSVRAELIESLKNAPTSLKESFYSIESVDNCNP